MRPISDNIRCVSQQKNSLLTESWSSIRVARTIFWAVDTVSISMATRQDRKYSAAYEDAPCSASFPSAPVHLFGLLVFALSAQYICQIFYGRQRRWMLLFRSFRLAGFASKLFYGLPTIFISNPNLRIYVLRSTS